MPVQKEDKKTISFADDAESINDPNEFVEEQARKGKNGEDEDSPFGEEDPDNDEVIGEDDDEENMETSSSQEKERTTILPKRPPGRPRKEDQRVVISVEQGKQQKQTTPEELEKLVVKKASQRELDEILDNLDYTKSGQFYISLTRVEPRTFKGNRISGYITRCEEKIDYEWIKNMYGGGTYDVFVHAMTNGTWHVKKRRRIDIAGDPIMTNMIGHDKDEEKIEKSRDVVEKTLIMSEKNVDRFQREAEQSRKEKDDLVRTLIEMKSKPPMDDGKAHIGLVKEFMDNSLKLTQDQLKRAEENERIANERFLEAQKQYREELRQLKQEMNEKSTRELNPLLAMIQADRKETNEKFAMLMSEAKSSQESMMKLFIENSKMQQENRDKVFEMSMRLQQESTKYKDEISNKRMEEMINDLREAKKAASTDIMSEFKKFKMLKELFAGEASETETPTESITDKIFNNLDAIPGIVGAIGSLFSKGQPMVVAPPQPQQALPPGMNQATEEVEEEEQEGEEATDQPVPTAQNVAQASPEQREAMKIQMAVGKIMKESEEAVAAGTDPLEFANTKVLGKYEDVILQRISTVPIKMIIAGLEQQINQMGADSILLTAGGRDFLTKVHKAISAKYSA